VTGLWFALFFYLGLSYWAWLDYHYGSVPALPFEVWCGLIYGYQCLHGVLWWPPLLWGLAFYGIVLLGGLGAADAWLIMVLASRFVLLSLLWLLLLSCATGLLQAGLGHRSRLPWLSHLALAAVLVSLWAPV
jgi:hypothetical protein